MKIPVIRVEIDVYYRYLKTITIIVTLFSRARFSFTTTARLLRSPIMLVFYAFLSLIIFKSFLFVLVLKCHDFTHHYHHHSPTPNIGFSKVSFYLFFT